MMEEPNFASLRSRQAGETPGAIRRLNPRGIGRISLSWPVTLTSALSKKPMSRSRHWSGL